MSRVVLLGAGGLLGRAIQAAWLDGDALAAYQRAQLDVTDADGVSEVVAGAAAVINCAAWTDVDGAESKAEACHATNAVGAEIVAAACERAGAALIHLSTDYVFGGAGAPFAPGDAVCPHNVYGRSKAEGEARIRARCRRHLIVRTSWLYAPGGRNFLSTLLRLGGGDAPLSVVDDQRACPTAADALARALVAVVDRAQNDRALAGTWHFCGADGATRYEFACAAASLGRLRSPIHRTSSAARGDPARRPTDSSLDCAGFAEVFGVAPRPWREELERVLTTARL